MNRYDVTSCVPPLSSAFSILPLLQFEWRDYSERKMTFNLKISPLVFPFLPLLPTHSISAPSSNLFRWVRTMHHVLTHFQVGFCIIIVCVITVGMLLQVLGIDLPSESKMSSEGEGRPGEYKSMLTFRNIFRISQTTMALVNTSFCCVVISSPSYLSTPARRRYPKEKVICPSY